MPTITALEPQRRRPRVNVFLDGRFAFALSLSFAEQRGLSAGRSLDSAEADALQEEDQRQALMESAWRLLSYRARTREELRTRLLRKGFRPELVQGALEDLSEQGYLDDSEFAQSLVEARLTGANPRGKQALRAELRRRGVDAEAGEAALAELDEAAAARRAAEKRIRSRPFPDYPSLLRHLAPFLQRRGFSYDTIRATVDALWQEGHGAIPEEGDSFFHSIDSF